MNQQPQNLEVDIETIKKLLRQMSLEEVASFMAAIYKAPNEA